MFRFATTPNTRQLNAFGALRTSRPHCTTRRHRMDLPLDGKAFFIMQMAVHILSAARSNLHKTTLPGAMRADAFFNASDTVRRRTDAISDGFVLTVNRRLWVQGVKQCCPPPPCVAAGLTTF